MTVGAKRATQTARRDRNCVVTNWLHHWFSSSSVLPPDAASSETAGADVSASSVVASEANSSSSAITSCAICSMCFVSFDARGGDVRRWRDRVGAQIASGFQQGELVGWNWLGFSHRYRVSRFPRVDFRFGSEGNTVLDCFVVTFRSRFQRRFALLRSIDSSNSAETACCSSVACFAFLRLRSRNATRLEQRSGSLPLRPNSGRGTRRDRRQWFAPARRCR